MRFRREPLGAPIIRWDRELISAKDGSQMPYYLLAARPELGLLFILVIIIAGVILYKWQSRGWHQPLIGDYFRKRGHEPLEVLWRPFGGNKLGEYSYLVRYRDSRGELHESSCRIDAWARVFISEEGSSLSNALKASDPITQRQNQLEEENRRLHAEIDRLRREAK
jgi:hypothetical protein